MVFITMAPCAASHDAYLAHAPIMIDVSVTKIFSVLPMVFLTGCRLPMGVSDCSLQWERRSFVILVSLHHITCFSAGPACSGRGRNAADIAHICIVTTVCGVQMRRSLQTGLPPTKRWQIFVRQRPWRSAGDAKGEVKAPRATEERELQYLQTTEDFLRGDCNYFDSTLDSYSRPDCYNICLSPAIEQRTEIHTAYTH